VARVGDDYVEHGGSWRPLWIVAVTMGVFVLLDVVLPGRDVPPLFWGTAAVATLGVVAAGCRSARQVWTVRVTGRGPDGMLSVGRERVALADVDVDHLRAVDSGVDAGAPVLGGGWSLPRGRTGLPLRFTDGRTVLVPTRDPAALYDALAARVTDASGDGPGTRGTLDR
jgi:hypothetical protein